MDNMMHPDDWSRFLDFQFAGESPDWLSSSTSSGSLSPSPSPGCTGLLPIQVPNTSSADHRFNYETNYNYDCNYSRDYRRGEQVILSFGGEEEYLGGGLVGVKEKKRSNPAYAQEHVRVERQRRLKLAQKFSQLSDILPQLQKVDKATILEEATKYIMQLEEQVGSLEQQVKEKAQELMDLRQKLSSKNSTSDEESNSLSNEEDCNNHDFTSTNSTLQIDAKVHGELLHINIFTKKDYDLVYRAVKEIEKYHLTALNTGIISFGKYYVDVSIVSQMDDKFCMSVEELVRQLRQAFI